MGVINYCQAGEGGPESQNFLCKIPQFVSIDDYFKSFKYWLSHTEH